jgi:hypothetical protein
MYDDFPLPRPDVKVDENQLLPRSQCHTPIYQRYGHRRLQQRRSYMAMTISIMPRFIVLVIPVLWDDLSNNLL